MAKARASSLLGQSAVAVAPSEPRIFFCEELTANSQEEWYGYLQIRTLRRRSNCCFSGREQVGKDEMDHALQSVPLNRAHFDGMS